MAKLSGFVTSSGDKAYFFTGNRYVRYDVAADAVDPGYPQPITNAWPGLFDGDIDAVLTWPDGSVYFFRGTQYIRYDMAADRAVDGYPKSIADQWPGVFGESIDAAMLWPGGQQAYFFRGEDYIRYDVASDRASDGYPKRIADHWPGLFTKGIEAALPWPNGDVFFFSGGLYVKYDVAADKAVSGYPRPIAGQWPGLPFGSAGGSGGQLPGTQVRDAFPGFTKQFEGRVPWMYLDVKGLVTIGVGNLIDPEGLALGLPFVHKQDRTPASAEEIRAEWRRVKADQSLAARGHRAAEPMTRLMLTEAAIDALVRTKFDANERMLRVTFPEWNDWPADARLGVLSMAWALGAGFTTEYRRFTAAARQRNWSVAAEECHISEEGNAGVAPRNGADVLLFQNAAAVEEKGLDRATLYYPNSA